MKCIRAETLYTGNAVVEGGACVLFEGTKIAGVARAPRGEVIGDFAVVTPALIDSHTHIGLCRSGEPGAEAEVNDRMDSILALSDALDSVQMDDPAFGDAVQAGVLYSCILPGSGNIIGGRSAVIRNYAAQSTEALVARAGLKAAFGYNTMGTHDWKGDRPWTRMGAMSLLRKALYDVRQKMEDQRTARGVRKREITFTAAEGVLREVLTGETVLRCHVHKIDDIASLLRLVDEFRLRITVEHACDVHEVGIFRELARRGIPVNFGPLDSFSYKVELKHENWRNLRLLLESGVRYGLMTDHPFAMAWQLLMQTRWFLRCGLSKQEAIDVVTRRNAELLGVDGVLGTLEKGKWASMVCWNGDPFALTSWPTSVWGEGKELYRE
jgi:imidazolonepropionase-like amidohydrolase